MTVPRKKLIEVALPLEAINKASAREKSIRHGHPSTLHLWWARRPLAAARAVIFAQMVDDPSSHPEIFRTEKAQEKERQRLFRIIEELVQWENTTNEEVLERARAEIWQSWRAACADNADHPHAKELFDRHKLPAFHDPFAGGGSLPLEAQRLGLEAYASDLNPVAVLICKAMIEIPPKFAGKPPVNPDAQQQRAQMDKSWRGAQGLAEDVRYYGQWIRDAAEKRIGHLYPQIEVTAEMAKERPDLKALVGRKLTVIAWLWARTVKSPNPAFAQVDVPLASTFMLSTRAGKEAYVEPVPVVQLQTNFGGGKTHSMLALYHLFSGTAPTELAGVDVVMKKASATSLPSARRVVLVGNRISPGNPVTKPDGTVIRTLWGELAWQLGGAAGGTNEAKKAFKRVAADDERATSPGDVLRELFREYGPCLILIDEWVAYARQLHDQGDLPAGSFETQFTFAQALTESARLAKDCLLVISLPASDAGGSPHAQPEDVEVGGQRGREALERLRNVVARVESSWRPASAEEGFEIVRRRLFEPLTDPTQFKDRDVVARAFADLYRAQQQEFPPECRDADYEKRIKAAYPIHPEIFDRLYTDWSTLVKFQRTRGVLRLMAAVIHSLWEKGDRNPLILPANVPIDDPRVQSELTRYLSDNWVPVIEKDVDGPNSLPLRIDGELAGTLGKFAATRRVARTIYLGSAATTGAAHRGLEDRQVKLGCVMPGEAPAVFGDALRRLAGVATYLYHDGPRYWYSTQPTVTKLAEDRAEQLKRDPDKVAQEIERRLRSNVRAIGDFSRVHPLPQSSQEVPDDADARLVVLRTDHPYSKDGGSLAEREAKAIFGYRGGTPRLFGNSLVFLAADQTRLQDLEEAVRRYLAWESILKEKQTLDLSLQQVTQAEGQQTSADGTVNARVPEAYQWLLVPVQASPSSAVEFQAVRLSGQDTLADRASKKLAKDELLLTRMAGTRLRMELDKIPLWRGDPAERVSVKQLVDDFARYVYLPRLKNSSVLINAVREGVALVTWEQDSFAYADSYDEASGRYRGLRVWQHVPITDNDMGLLVRPGAARRQIDAEMQAQPSEERQGERGGEQPGKSGRAGTSVAPPAAPKFKRFHAAVVLDPERVGRDASRIADEVVSHLKGLDGAKVKVTLEIEAEMPEGAPDNVVRNVNENSRTLKFTSYEFEPE